ncbi:MAG: methionine ABC transporter ATP-binding protein [Eubacteriaceae bacterium]|jgi:D-methionine transport system ATP-binding protein
MATENNKQTNTGYQDAAFDAAPPAIQIQNLTKKFETKNGTVTALQDVNLSIPKGEIFGIIGLSGAGKSTLVRCMNLLERPTEGKVFINGRDLNSLDNKELRRARYKIGMIFQQFNLLEQRTAIQNVMFALEITGVEKEAAKKRAAELLEIVGLEDRAQSYPAQLSGGQKQRVAIARALANNPSVILCDEATSALDPKTTRQILSLLKDLNNKYGITIVVITHEMAVVEEICTQVAIIDNSRIAETGSVEQIFNNPQTDIARRMIYPEGDFTDKIGHRAIRIVFDGASSFEPVFADMILECKAMVNIMFADMKNLNGTAVGQMIIQLPEDQTTAEHVIGFLRSRNLTVEEIADV